MHQGTRWQFGQECWARYPFSCSIGWRLICCYEETEISLCFCICNISSSKVVVHPEVASSLSPCFSCHFNFSCSVAEEAEVH